MSKEIVHILHEVPSSNSNIIPLFSLSKKQRNDAIEKLNFLHFKMIDQITEMSRDMQRIQVALKNKETSSDELRKLAAAIDGKYYFLSLL